MRAVPRILSYTLAFALKLKKNHGKPSVMVAENCQLGAIKLVDRAVLIATATNSVTFDTLGLRFS
jgi:hypothetical protein